MGLLSSLFAGVSGLNSSGTAISVIGDNIANTGTTGYKASRAEFVDVLSGSLGGVAGSGQVGAGSRVSGTNQTFLQGSLESTGLVTDLAVDGGGFFLVQDAQGVFYTRAGLFRLDANQVLINPQGQTVLGFGITPSGAPSGAVAPVDLSNVSSAPNPTTQVEVNVNLDPADTALAGGASGFDHTDPVNSSNFQTGLSLIDSLGNPHDLLVYFRKDDAANNSWFWYAGVNRDQLDLASYGAPFSTFTTTVATQNQFFPVQTGSLTFDGSGNLQLEDNTALSISYDSDGDGVADTAATATPGNAAGWNFNFGALAGQLLGFDFGQSITEGGTGANRTTQYGGTAASGANNFIRFTRQDGYEEGSLNAIDINENGFVTGIFSNGQTQRLAQIALARFANINGLERVGKNSWIETIASGNPVIGSPNQASFGAIRSGFLEQSNTDLAEEFVKLILSQRAFQANTRTISTTNELLASLVNLGQ
jgi:flagellar hook protein FlgE